MDSRCLSAAGLRFLRHPIPTREFCVPYGSLTGHRPDPVGLTTFRNSRRGDWFRRPLCRVSIGYPQPSTGHLRFPAQTLGRQPLPKFSITQLQPRIHFRSPCQPFPSPDAPFGLGQSLGIFLVLPHSAVTGNACEEREQMGYSSVVFRRTPFLQHRVARPGWSRTIVSWVWTKRRCRWTTGLCYSSGVTESRTRISTVRKWRRPVGP